MGSASAWACTQHGASVIAFDRYAPPHHFGSTHGHTRIIREAYYEHPLYVPLVRRAYELWSQLEAAAGERLWQQTGGIMVGPEDGPLVRGASGSARAHGIRHEMLDARAFEARFPMYRTHADWVALFEERAGILFPERCLRAFHRLAHAARAELCVGAQVMRWSATSEGVRVHTTRGDYDARCLVVSAGPWLPTFAAQLHTRIPLEIERQLSHWFRPVTSPELFAADRCPVGLWETKPDDVFATLPDEGHGVKCGTHHAGATTSADGVIRSVTADEQDAVRAVLDMVMPGAAGELLESRVCLYTNTPDHHFIIDWDVDGRVLVASPCSGHGFKFASAIGEIVAQLTLEGRSWIDLAPFSLSRFR